MSAANLKTHSNTKTDASLNIVLLPGMDGTGDLFVPLTINLPENLTPIVISYPLDQALSYQQLLLNIKPQLPKNPFVLLAESFAGPLAKCILNDPQLRVSHCVFVASFVSNPNPKLLTVCRYLPLSPLLKLPIPNWLLKYFCFAEFSEVALFQLFRLATKKVHSKVLAYRIKHMAELPTRLISQEQVELDQSSNQLLKMNQANCLNIVAKRDRLVHSVAKIELFNWLNSQNFRSVETLEIDAPHFVIQTRPTEVITALLKFLKLE